MKNLLTIIGALVIVSCAAEVDAEQEGMRLIGSSRFSLSVGDYESARDSIFALRRNFPTAIKARRQAILLLDSIELLSAADSVRMFDAGEINDETGENRERLNIKMQFYERKLSEDLRR